MNAKLLFIQSLSPLHAGTGQGVGVIDQPIAREKATNIPFLPGSSIKGVFRDAYTGPDKIKIFGPETDNAEDHASSVTFSDARLILLPVRSLAGVFAWVTSPFILQRFKRDLKDIPFESEPQIENIIVENKTCLVCEDSSPLIISETHHAVVLEDIKLTAEKSPELQKWANFLSESIFPEHVDWQTSLKDRLCLVSDDVFSFLLEIGTEVTARIRIEEDRKTAAEHALWYEEALPAETILSSLAMATNLQASPEQVYKAIEGLSLKTLQFGGSATVGRGLCKATLVPKEIS
jgi:CRISPR-associated protein Cmr4